MSKTHSLNKWNPFYCPIYWLLQLVSSVISCMDATQEHCKDAEFKTQLGVERCGLDARLPLEVWWLIYSNGAEEGLCLCQTFCLPHFLLHFLLFSSCSPVFFSPHNSHSFSAASPVAQHCGTSLASIIPGSDEPTDRGKSDNVWKIFPPVWGQSHQAKPLVCGLNLTIPKQAERM